jgi:hypothetical protein
MISPTDVTKTSNRGDGLVFHQDPVEDLLKIFDGALRIVVPGPGREVVGLKAISEKQTGAPGWYMWFNDRPGAYLLELTEAGTRAKHGSRSPSNREAVQGSYRIKYYPAVTDPASLASFSASEQAFRESDCFDASGTPDFEQGEEIPDAFFEVGAIETGLAADAEGFVLRLDAPDRWVTWTTEGVAATDEQGVSRCLRTAGEKDRDVPAWLWSWFLMDRLVMILCLAYSTAPRQVGLYDAPGYAFRIGQNGFSLALPDGAIRRRWLSISFHLHNDHATPSGSWPIHPPPGDPSLLLDPLSGECRASLCQEPAASLPWVSSDWWHVREKPLDLGSVLPC